PDRPEGAARANLRVLLLRVRQQPGFDALELQAERVRWRMPSDLQRFDDAAAAGDDAAVVALHPLVPLLDGLEPGLPEPALEWLQRERNRVVALWRAAAARRLTAFGGPAGAADAAQLAARISALDPAAAGTERVITAAAMRADADAFIGRRAEAGEVQRRLAAVGGTRWLVVTGPGGIGKTALLRAVLPRLAPAFPAGTVAVALADLDDIAQVPARVAAALGVALLPKRPAWAQVADAIGERALLLALDNTEQLNELDDALATLLANCPALKLLTASRARPAHAAEVLALDGLPLPDDDDAADADVLRRFDAVRLFEARARAAAAGFSVARRPHDVVRLLRACDGMPLAIELAAAATRLMPVEDIAAELSRSLDVLDAGRAARGLRATFDRSWRLLDDPQRAGLSQLAWLPGPFGRELAEQAADVPLSMLAALLDASLLQAATPRRFALHPLLRQFVTERAPPEDADALAARHASWCGHWLEALAGPGRSMTPQAADAIAAELPHLRAAWAWAAASGAATLLTRFASAMGAYFVQRGGVQEVLPFLAQAVATMPVHGRAGLAAKARTRRTQAMLEYHAGDLPSALAHAREALRWAGRAGDVGVALGCLTVLGNALLFAGEVEAARAHFEQAQRSALARDELSIAAAAANGLGLVERALGRFDAAMAHLREAGRLYARSGDVGGQVVALINAGNIEMELQRFAAARRSNEEALAVVVAHRIDARRAILETILAEVALELGDRAAARRHIDAAFAAEPASGDVVVPTQLRIAAARLAAAEGRADAAHEALAQAVSSARRSGSSTMALSCVGAAARLLAGAGDRVAAARLWHWVHAHPRATHPLRADARRSLEALPAAASGALQPVGAAEGGAAATDATDAVLVQALQWLHPAALKRS
ncbi:MAG TPA: AAA family ATPase, partial [Burkholderiaceae bacterium]|nr:AAA family ATPase [Burkholderiaceae bacterium]